MFCVNKILSKISLLQRNVLNSGRTIEKLKTIDGDEGCDGLLQFTIVDTRSNYDVSKLLMVRDDVTRLEADVEVVEGARLSAGDVYDVIVMMKNPGPVWSRDMIDWREIYIEVVDEACLMSPCLNRATCIQPDEQDEFHCLCTSGRSNYIIQPFLIKIKSLTENNTF